MDDLIQPLPEQVRPKLWNPNAAAAWGLLLSPAFGAWLVAANWRTLGNREMAKANMAFFWMTLAFATVNVGTMFLPDSKLLDRAMQAGGVGLLVGWYFQFGRGQVRHLKEMGNAYEKKSWGRPLLIGFAAVAAYVAVCIGIAFLTYVPSGEDMADDLRPTILEQLHSKPDRKDATIERIVLDAKGHGVYRGFIDATIRERPVRMTLKATYEGGSLSYEITWPVTE